MKKWMLLFIILFSFAAQAKTLMFSCKWDETDLSFSTDVDDNAVEIRRAYDWHETVFYIRIPISKDSDETWADVQVTQDGKSTTHKAFCLSESL